MMRYPAEHKEETHERIVRTASRRFRRSGAGVGIAELMKALKLTHGGFYRHFRNKNELLSEALTNAFGDIRTRVRSAVEQAPPERKLQTMIETYLSEEHCRNAGGGCPMAALASEAHRYPRAVRAAMERAVEEIASTTARLMPGASEEERRQKALVLFSGMAGTLAVARAVTDEQSRRTLLEAARKTYIEAFTKHR